MHGVTMKIFATGLLNDTLLCFSDFKNICLKSVSRDCRHITPAIRLVFQYDCTC